MAEEHRRVACADAGVGRDRSIRQKLARGVRQDGRTAVADCIRIPPAHAHAFASIDAQSIIIVQATIWLSYAILLEASLSYLGLGVVIPTPSWGNMLQDGQRELLGSMRSSLLAPLLGLPGLAVPVGRHGRLRTGVQIKRLELAVFVQNLTNEREILLNLQTNGVQTALRYNQPRTFGANVIYRW